MFWKRKKASEEMYDRTGKTPVIRASICTGEKVAGFKDIKSNRFEDLMVIRDEKDLQLFIKKYGVNREDIQKEW